MDHERQGGRDPATPEGAAPAVLQHRDILLRYAQATVQLFEVRVHAREPSDLGGLEFIQRAHNQRIFGDFTHGNRASTESFVVSSAAPNRDLTRSARQSA